MCPDSVCKEFANVAIVHRTIRPGPFSNPFALMYPLKKGISELLSTPSDYLIAEQKGMDKIDSTWMLEPPGLGLKFCWGQSWSSMTKVPTHPCDKRQLVRTENL